MAECKVLKPTDVAKELGISLPLVYRQLRAGNIPSIKLGDRFLIPRDAFNKWLSVEKTS